MLNYIILLLFLFVKWICGVEIITLLIKALDSPSIDYNKHMKNELVHEEMFFDEPSHQEVFRVAYDELFVNAFPEDELDTYEDIISYGQDAPDAYYCSVALKDGKVAGGVTGYNVFDVNAVVCDMIVVNPENRRQGIASAMIKQMLADLSERDGKDIDALILECEKPSSFEGEEREQANGRLEFYQKLGFKAIETPYIAPPLEEGKNSLDTMMFAILPNTDQPVTSITREFMEAFVTDMFSGWDIDDEVKQEYIQKNITLMPESDIPIVPIIEKQCLEMETMASNDRVSTSVESRMKL